MRAGAAGGMVNTIMRIAVLADVHGNLPALRAVLRDIDADPVDAIVVGGDVVGGPLAGSARRMAGGHPAR